MLVQNIVDRIVQFLVTVISWFPTISLPSVDLTLVVYLIGAVNGIIPASALGIALALAASVWIGRGIMLGVRWALWLAQLVRG